MSYQKSLNYNPANNDALWYELKRILKLAGATVTKSSDGLSYNSSGDQITTATSGAGGIANTNAWYVLALQGGQQLCIQRGNQPYNTRIKFSPAVGFTTGSPGITQTPLASDEQLLCGTGTDAAPGFSTWMTTSAGSARSQIMANDASPYGFYCITYTTTFRPTSILAFDPLVTGSYPSQDIYPYVLHCSGSSSSGTLDRATLCATSAGPFAYLNNGSWSLVRVPMEEYQSNSARTYPDGIVNSALDSKDPTRPIMYSRNSSVVAPLGDKGKSTLFKWSGVARTHLDLYSIVTTKDYARMGDLLCVWDGSTTPA